MENEDFIENNSKNDQQPPENNEYRPPGSTAGIAGGGVLQSAPVLKDTENSISGNTQNKPETTMIQAQLGVPVIQQAPQSIQHAPQTIPIQQRPLLQNVVIQNQFQPRPNPGIQGPRWERLPVASVSQQGLLGSAPIQMVRPGLIGVRPNFQTLNPRPIQAGLSVCLKNQGSLICQTRLVFQTNFLDFDYNRILGMDFD